MFQCKTLTKQTDRFKKPVSNTISLYFVGVQVIPDLRKASWLYKISFSFPANFDIVSPALIIYGARRAKQMELSIWNSTSQISKLLPRFSFLWLQPYYTNKKTLICNLKFSLTSLTNAIRKYPLSDYEPSRPDPPISWLFLRSPLCPGRGRILQRRGRGERRGLRGKVSN